MRPLRRTRTPVAPPADPAPASRAGAARLGAALGGLGVLGAVLLASATPASGTTAAPPPQWGQCAASDQTLATGVVLSCEHDLPGTTGQPSVAHVATIDLAANGVTPAVVLGNDTVYQLPTTADSAANETVSSMANRTSAVLGINGGFFDNDKGTTTTPKNQPYSGQICGGFVTEGRIVKSPPADPALNYSLNVHDDGHLSIGPVTFTGTVSTAGASIPLDGVNALDVAAPQPSCPKALMPGPTVANGVTLITPDLGTVVLAQDALPSTDYAIRNAVLITAHQTAGSADSYVVDTVTESPLLTSIPAQLPGNVALLSSVPESPADPSGAGGPDGALSTAEWMLANLPVGTAFTAGGQLDDPTITALIGGPAPLRENGVNSDLSPFYVPTDSNAETMVGLDATGRQVTVVVVDDYSGWSKGVTPTDAQSIMQQAGATSAILFDGGGSSTLVAALPASTESAPASLPARSGLPGQVDAEPGGPCPAGVAVITSQSGDNNFPNGCENQRLVGDALVFVPTAAPPTLPPNPTPSPDPTPSPTTPAPPGGDTGGTGGTGDPTLAATGAAPLAPATLTTLLASVAAAAAGAVVLLWSRVPASALPHRAGREKRRSRPRG